MNAGLQNILERFVRGESLSGPELNEIGQLFSDRNRRLEIDHWISGQWEDARPDDIEISYERLEQKIKEHKESRANYRFYRQVVTLSNNYRKIAAILFVPLILGLTYLLFFTAPEDENFYVSEAPLGQKARVELPDGSLVWLNSGSSIRYSSAFNLKNRKIDLTGEAFFDVKTNEGKAFIVQTRFLDIEVTGTRFNVSAYDDEPMVQTALVEGKVNLILKDQQKDIQMDPGKVISFSKATHAISSSVLNEDATTGWKENRLIFIKDDFSRLVRKIEKWYDVDVIYNPADFEHNKLTVKLLEGERLDQLLEIIEAAVGAKCTVDENKLYITRK